MSITSNTAAQYTASTVSDIYKILFTGDEWATEQRLEVGLDKPRVLPKAKSSQNLFQANVANPRLTNAAGDIAITNRLLEVDRVMSLPKITPEDWRADFPEFQPSGTTIDLVMNPNVMNAVLEVLKNGVNTQIADLVYKGDTLGAAQLLFTDGYSKKFKADAEVVDVANIGIITTANALDILQDITNAVPARMKSIISMMPIYMNKTTWDLVQEADRATQQNSTILQQKDQFSFRGHPLKWMASMTDNELFTTPTGTGKDSNLVRGVWFEGDIDNFLMYREQPADEDWLIALKFSLGFQYRTGEDVIFYLGA